MHVPRSPQNTAIYKIVRENYRQVFFDKEQLEIHLPFHLERLCRYVMRGPLSQERVTYEAGRVQLKLKSPYLDGTTHLQFTAEQFIKRMIALIPPPRQNLIRYVGFFKARHKKRQIITSKAKPKDKKEKSGKKENLPHALGRTFKTCF